MARDLGGGGIRRAVDYRIDARVRNILIRELGAILRGGKVQGGAVTNLPAGSLTTRWEPLTTGDPAAPAYVFTPEGDSIVVEVPN